MSKKLLVDNSLSVYVFHTTNFVWNLFFDFIPKNNRIFGVFNGKRTEYFATCCAYLIAAMLWRNVCFTPADINGSRLSRKFVLTLTSEY